MNAHMKYYSFFDDSSAENIKGLNYEVMSPSNITSLERFLAHKNCVDQCSIYSNELPKPSQDSTSHESKQHNSDRMIGTIGCIFNPFSHLGREQAKEEENLKSGLKNLQAFEEFLNSQNCQGGAEHNILSEQYLLKRPTAVIENPEEKKAREEETTQSLSRTISSQYSIGNESEKDNSLVKGLQKKRKRDKTQVVYKQQVERHISIKKEIDSKQIKKEDQNAEPSKKPHSFVEVYPFEQFEKDLSEIEKSPRMSFMKNHFPVMFTHENFYKNTKLNKEKRRQIKQNVNVPTEMLLFSNLISSDDSIDNCNYYSSTSSNPKWKPSPSDFQIGDFITGIQNIWPYDKFIFTEEKVLEFLMINDYNAAKVYKKTSESHLDFEQFFEQNLLMEPSSNQIKRKNNYSFRRKIKN